MTEAQSHAERVNAPTTFLAGPGHNVKVCPQATRFREPKDREDRRGQKIRQPVGRAFRASQAGSCDEWLAAALKPDE